GTSLRSILERGPLEVSRALELFDKIARGVAAAHERGIVHRDLTPANILLTDAGEPKVADFGLAHEADSTRELTRTGATLGTPLYMSPEQVQGRAKEVSPRTDVYALGVILYQALAGRLPHLGETMLDMYEKIAREDAPPVRAANPQVSRDLE